MIRMAMAAAILAAGAARAEPFTATYDVYLGGLRGGELSLAVERDEDAYAAKATLRAAGLAAWIFPGHATAEAAGAWRAAAPAPDRFDAEGDFSGTRQTVTMAFAPGAPLALDADPPLRKRSYDADLSALGDALDPLSAAVAALAPTPAAAVCGRTISVFDSRRRFDLALSEPRREGASIRCEGEFRRVAGFKRKHMDRPPHPFTVWWRVEDGMATFDRAQAPTNFGHAVALRRD
jgi:hypothetical protein